jgi:hypothetical protein
VAKSERDEVPPWVLVGATLGADIAVASWNEDQYGTPSFCRGDDYSAATSQYCLAAPQIGLALGAGGGAPASVENALAAVVDAAHGAPRAWGLWGNLYSSFTSHAKYAVGSASHVVVSGDMNQQVAAHHET